MKRSAPHGAAVLLTAAMATLACSVGSASAHDRAPTLPTLTQLTASISAAPPQTTLPRAPIPALADVTDGPSAAEYRGQTGCGDQTPGARGDLVTEKACTFGDRSATRVILVTGDSEADMWIPTLDAWGRAEHWKIARLVDFGCVPWTVRPNYLSPANVNCGRFEAMVAAWVREHRPQIVFPVGLLFDSQGGWVDISGAKVAQAIERMTDAWKPSGARVLVPQNIPWFYNYGYPQDCLAAYPKAVERCNDDPRSKVVSEGMADGMSIAAKAGLIEIVPTERLFCTSAVCPVLVGPWIVYADEHHFARTWANHIERAFGALFDPVVQRASAGAGLARGRESRAASRCGSVSSVQPSGQRRSCGAAGR